MEKNQPYNNMMDGAAVYLKKKNTNDISKTKN
jgi:hypothetical protein